MMTMSRWALFAVLMLGGAFVGAWSIEELGPHLGVLAMSPLMLAIGLTMESAIDHRKRQRGSR
jgi:hypothetical protein